MFFTIVPSLQFSFLYFCRLINRRFYLAVIACVTRAQCGVKKYRIIKRKQERALHIETILSVWFIILSNGIRFFFASIHFTVRRRRFRSTSRRERNLFMAIINIGHGRNKYIFISVRCFKRVNYLFIYITYIFFIIYVTINLKKLHQNHIYILFIY